MAGQPQCFRGRPSRAAAGAGPAAEPAPASDDPFAPSANSRQDARDELRASSRENVAEQTDGRLEREATEFENTSEQRDAQQEFEAAR